MTNPDNVGGLPVEFLKNPAAVVYPDTGYRSDVAGLQLWQMFMYDTGGEPLFSADQVRELCRAALLRTLSRVAVQEGVNFRGEDYEDAHRVLTNTLIASKSWVRAYAEGYVDDFARMAASQRQEGGSNG